MLGALSQLALPLLHALDPETAHELTLRALEAGLYPRAEEADDPRLAQTVMGLSFANPVGLAAGFDKDARVASAFLEMGCGCAEVGTLTPKPQGGNARPRVFRSLEDKAVINRLGFPNEGHKAALARLARLARLPATRRGVLGVNVGANRDSRDRIADYAAGVEAFAGVADYLTINISSPNTPGLRDLQVAKALDELLARVMAAREKAEGKPPVVVKLAPDMDPQALAETVACLESHRVDGVMVSNTTLAREGLRDRVFAHREGGLSGRPLFERSTAMLAKVHMLTEGRLPLIGVGGIDSGTSAIAKIEAGASLVQLYTGLVFSGPPLFGEIKRAICSHLSQNGLSSMAEMTGRKAEEWAAKYK